MPLAVHGSSSETLLTSPGMAVALTFATLLVTILMFVLQWITSRPRRRIITIGILSSARLADRPETLAYLRALYGYEKCVNARISTVALNYRGDRDIRKASFEDDQPFRIEVGARVIDLLGASSEPEQTSLPIVKAAGVALEVGPSLLRNGQGLKFVILTDGPCKLSPKNLPADVDMGRGTGYQAQEDAREARRAVRRFRLAPIFSWAIIIFFAFYLITQPTGAAHVLNGLGATVANWVNSL